MAVLCSHRAGRSRRQTGLATRAWTVSFRRQPGGNSLTVDGTERRPRLGRKGCSKQQELGLEKVRISVEIGLCLENRESISSIGMM